MIKGKNILFILITGLFGISITVAQGGLYSICDPKGKYSNVKEECLALGDIFDNKIKEIAMIEFHGGWKNVEEAKEQLFNELQDKKIKACSIPRWNIDFPVEIVGIIIYKDNSQGKVAVAQHRVGFQDSRGEPWYFEWVERIPWKK